MGTVVTSHALEVARQDLLLATDLLKGAACVVLQLFKLATDLWQRATHLFGVLLGLLEMRAPLFPALLNLTELEFVGDTLNFELPLLFADI